MVADRHAYGLSFFVLLLLSGCSTISTEAPKDPGHYAEIDVMMHDETPEVVVENIAAYSGLSSKYFSGASIQKGPDKFFLSPGTYLLRAGCFGAFYITSEYGEPVPWSPEFKIEVEAGKKYWVGCNHGQSDGGVYFQPQ